MKKMFLIFVLFFVFSVSFAQTPLPTWMVAPQPFYTDQLHRYLYMGTPPAGFNTTTPVPTATSTITPTIQPTAWLVQTDSSKNIYSTLYPNTGGTTAATTVGLFNGWISSQIDDFTPNFLFHNPNAIWLDMDNHNQNYMGLDQNDMRLNTIGPIFFRAVGSPTVESSPTLYDFELNNGDRDSRDFMINQTNVLTWMTFGFNAIFFGGIDSGGATISASNFGYQPNPTATITPGTSGTTGEGDVVAGGSVLKIGATPGGGSWVPLVGITPTVSINQIDASSVYTNTLSTLGGAVTVASQLYGLGYLQVVNNMAVGGNVTVGGSGLYDYGSAFVTGTIQIANPTFSNLYIQSTNFPDVRISAANSADTAGINMFLNPGGGQIGIGSTTSNYLLDVDGNIGIQAIGGGVRVAEGSGAKQGSVTLSSGSAVVSNSNVTANSRIFLTAQSLGTIITPASLAVTARTPGTSFTVGSSASNDTSVVAYEIFEPY